MIEKLNKMLAFIASYKVAHDGNSPTVRQMRDALGYHSTSVISAQLAKLETLGYITRQHAPTGTNRMISLEGGLYIPPIPNRIEDGLES